ncbi:MAG TPA: TonB-dependent receptor [Bacteroidales bacterium]|nr:TonB-dependent receptor [Bacteroidales bacterium]
MKQKLTNLNSLFRKPLFRLVLVTVILSITQASFVDLKGAEKNSVTEPTTPQQLIVNGTVKDENGQPMPGVNIQVEGTTIGGITDINGSYSIVLPRTDAVLIFTFVGYTEMRIPAAGKNRIDVSLQPDTETLDEVVVVGYGTQKKKDVASAITVVDAQQIAKQPVSNVATALQGLVPGIQVTATRNSGSPDIVIRGLGTTQGTNSPLYVIDGIPQSGLYVNPSDIETMQVLKDAASAAIYGSRGANGVILITTKSGRNMNNGQPKVSLRSYYGVEQPWKLLDLTTTAEWASVVYDSNGGAGSSTLPALAKWIVEQNGGKYTGPETDWQDRIFQTGALVQNGIDISGGTDAGSYFFSAEQYKQEGIIITTPNNRYSVRLNSNWRSNKFNFGENVSFTYSDSRSETVPDGRSAIQQAINMTPNIPVYDITQQPGGYANFNWTNPDYSPALSGHDAGNVVAYLNRVKNMNYNKRLIASAYGEYQIMAGLTFRSTFGVTSSDSEGRNFTLATQGQRLTNTTLNENHSWTSNWIWDQTLNYGKQIGKHDFSLMGTYSAEYSKNHNFSAGGQTIQTEIHDVLGKVESNFSVGGGETEQSRLSYLGRLTYSYAGKYILVANIRRDGSSKFNEGNKWGIFPSASVAWNISQESFMDGIKERARLSRMKLRGSFGVVGNDGPIGAYSYVPALSASNYNNGSTGIVGQTVSNLTKNPNLKWEKSEQLDLGAELGFFKNALSVEVDFYNKKTKDMLVGVPIPGSSGSSGSITQNVGSILNRGWEFQATYRKATGDFHYSIGANLTTNYNEVLNLAGQVISAGGSEFASSSTRTEAGYPIGMFYGYKTLGLFQTQAEIDAYVDANGAKMQPNAAPGDIKFYKKPNAEGGLVGVIGANDMVYIGDPAPDFTYGINLSADFKGLDLTVFFQGVQGNDLLGILTAWTEGMHNNFNLGKNALNRWTPTNTNTTVPRAVRGDPNKNTNISDRYIYDGSYLRLKNLTLGYTLPKAWVNYVKLSNVRVYATGRNLFTLTSYPFYDPEIGSGYVGLSSSGNSSTARGIDNGYYPQARSLIMGIQIDF